MGLIDDPIGFFVGGDDEKGVVDTRADRTAEGQRFWERWEEIFGPGGAGDPSKIYEMALGHLTAPPVNIGLDGMRVPVYPKSYGRQASALVGLLQPWLEGGLLLEQGRKGMGYYRPGDDGLLGDMQTAFATSFAGNAGKGMAGGLGGIMGQPSLSNS